MDYSGTNLHEELQCPITRIGSSSHNSNDSKPPSEVETFHQSRRKKWRIEKQLSKGTRTQVRLNNLLQPSHVRPSDLAIFLGMLKNWISPLLIFVPIGIMAHVRGFSEVSVFWLNFIALVPLAKLLGDATEELAEGLENGTLAGLLNASFGNAVELIIVCNALRADLFDVVAQTLVGSVLSNLLLVLGCSFLAGGLSYGKEQRFAMTGALANMTLLFLSCIFVAISTMFAWLPNVTHEAVLSVSRVNAVVMISGYTGYLFFQLVTHSSAFEDMDSVIPETGDDDSLRNSDKEMDSLSIKASLFVLSVSTLLVALCSEFLVSSIHGLVSESGIPSAFIGVILLPIVGNACEHAAAIKMAYYDKVSITVGIAIGSSTQIAGLVMPFAILAGWAMDKPMTGDFSWLSVALLVFSVLLTFTIVTDGRANWLEGYCLIVAYVMIGSMYWFFPEALDV